MLARCVKKSFSQSKMCCSSVQLNNGKEKNRAVFLQSEVWKVP